MCGCRGGGGFVIRVEVTAEDIGCGVRRNAGLCMISRALRRLGFEVDSVQPWNWEGSIDGRGPHGWISLANGEEVDLPFEAAEIARDWDDGGEVEPFAFEISVTP